jgi:hypothetical protein
MSRSDVSAALVITTLLKVLGALGALIYWMSGIKNVEAENYFF